MDTRSRPPALVPRGVLVFVAVIAATAAVAGMWYALSGQPDLVSVPAVTGLESPVARSRLAQAGLLMETGDVRFSSTVPEGAVISQRPAAGSSVPLGDRVLVIVSAGSETFSLPDIIGEPVERARATLQTRGLVVELESTLSEAEEGTVISSVPSPGVQVATGSLVRLTVAAKALDSDALLPADLSGVRVLIDPLPPEPATADLTLEIARRLRALLEASGADVVVTRSITETVTVAVRVSRAADTSPTAVLGLDVGAGLPAGRLVVPPPSTPAFAAHYLHSIRLADALSASLAETGEDVSVTLPVADEVLLAGTAPGVRLSLGSTQDPEDVALFADPVWADTVARALYRGLAEVLASP